MPQRRRHERPGPDTITALVLGTAAALFAVGMIVTAVLTMGHTKAEGAHQNDATVVTDTSE